MKITEIEFLNRIFNSLPKLNCKGLCGESCGPIHISRLEMRYIEDYCKKNNIKIHTLPTKLDAQHLLKVLSTADDCQMCPYLKNNKCKIYPVRPLICRLWGMVDSMPCLWGCKPDRIISDAESHILLDKIQYGS